MLLLYLVWGVYLFGWANFHQLDKNAYRSAQMFDYNLEYFLKEYQIKSILNLRGAHPERKHYQDEIRIAQELNVLHYNYEMQSYNELNSSRINALLEILKEAPKPLLIHCRSGADRTGLVSALYMLQNGAPFDEAKKHLSYRYGHILLFHPKTVAMDKTLLKAKELIAAKE